MQEASRGWPRNVLLAVAVLAPFNVKVTTDAWTDLQLRLLIVVALIAVVALVGHVVSQGKPDLIDWLAFGWLGAVWLSALTSNDLVLGAGGAARLSVAILLIPATRGIVRSRADKLQLLRAIAVGTGLAVLVGLSVWLLGDELDATRAFVGKVTKLGPFNRLSRPWAHANVAAMALGATMATQTTLKSPRLRAAGLGLTTVALVLTISRGGLVGATVAAIAWMVLRRRREEAAAIGVLAVLGAIVIFSSSAWTTRVDQLGDEAFFALTIDAPAEISIDGNDNLVQVRVTNRSTTTWLREGEDRVLISARWLGPDDLIWTEDWWQLPADLAPGQSVIADVNVATRLPNGEYLMRWDLVVPDTAYFGQFLGDAPVLSSADITGSPVVAADVFRYELVERAIGLGRVDGWKLAWNDFTSAPLLGVGPNQFADQANADLARQQRSIGAHAHNIVLEPLATWGLAGTVPFLVLGALALGRCLRHAWRTRDQVATVIAVGLVAVATHGIVDWPLVVITTGIPIGLLVGLALVDEEPEEAVVL